MIENMTTIGNQLTPFPVDINERALRAEVDTLRTQLAAAQVELARGREERAEDQRVFSNLLDAIEAEKMISGIPPVTFSRALLSKLRARLATPEPRQLSMTIYTALKLRYPIHCRECGDDMLARPRDGVTEVRRVSDAVFACPSCHPWSARHATPEPER